MIRRSDWNGNWHVEGEKGSLCYAQGETKLHAAPEGYKVTEVQDIEKQGPELQGQDHVLDDFMSAVRAGRRAKTDVFDNIRSIATVFAAVEAVRSGQRVEILDDDIRAMLEERPG